MNKVTTILTLMQTQFESPLHDSAKNNDINALRDIISQHHERINETNENNETPLYLAAANGHDGCVEYLISENAAINITKKKHLDHDLNVNATPLFIACRNGHLSTVKILLNAKAEVGKAIIGGVTPLYIAAENGHTAIVHELLNHGAGVDRAAYNGATPLFVASFKGNLEAVQKLIEYHANVDKSCQGMTPLLAAAQEGHKEIVATLLEFDADIDQDSNEGNTALYVAAQYGHLDVVKILLSKGANVDAANDNGCTPLFIASVNGNAEIVHELLKASADVDYDNDHGASPLYVAAHNGFIDVMKELLAHDAQVDKMYGDQTPLHVAAENGYTEAIQELIAYEADVDIAMDNGATALYLAADRGYTEIVKELLSAQAAIDIKCEDATPLFVASENGHVESVKVLLAHKADVNCTKSGATPLYVAAQNGHLPVVNELVRWKGNLHQTYHGKTPLYIGAQNGHLDIVTTLVNAGSDVNQLCKLADNPYLDDSTSPDMRRSSIFIRSHNQPSMTHQSMDISAIPREDMNSSVSIPPTQEHPQVPRKVHPSEPSTTTNIEDNDVVNQTPATPQHGGASMATNVNPNAGMTCLAAAIVWNHPKVVDYLIEQQARITLQNEYGYSLIDMNLNPKIESQLIHQETKQELVLDRQFHFVERVAVKTECLAKEGLFAEDIEILWELFSQFEEQDQLAYHIPKSEDVKVLYQQTNKEMTEMDVRMEDCEALLKEHSAKQEQLVQQTYISDKQHLSIFYLTFYIRFLQLLVGSLIVNERVTKYESVKDITINPGKNQHAPKNLKSPGIKLGGEIFRVRSKSDLQKQLTILLKYISNLELGQMTVNEMHHGQFSLVARTMTKVALVAERFARLTTIRYEHQINQLTVPSSILLAETGIIRLIHYFTHNAFGVHSTPEAQLSNVLFKFESVHPKILQTSSKILNGWTSDGVYRCSGIRTGNHSLYRGNVESNCCHLPEQYGFRLGDSTEVSALGLQPTNMDVLTQRYENPLFSLLARREKPPAQEEDERTNALELKVAKLEQLNRVQSNRMEETERLLRAQSDLIHKLQQQLHMNESRHNDQVTNLYQTMQSMQHGSGPKKSSKKASSSSSSGGGVFSRGNSSLFSRFKKKRAPADVYSVQSPTVVHKPPAQGERAKPFLTEKPSYLSPITQPTKAKDVIVNKASSTTKKKNVVENKASSTTHHVVTTKSTPSKTTNLMINTELMNSSDSIPVSSPVYDPNDSGGDEEDGSDTFDFFDDSPTTVARKQREHMLSFEAENKNPPKFSTNTDSKVCSIM